MSRIGQNNSGLGTFLNPAFYLDDYVFGGYVIFAAFGIPINLLVVGSIIFFQRFHSPRNFTWLGVGFSNIYVLIGFIIDSIYVRLEGSSSWLTYLFELINGLPLLSLVLNLHLTLINRYIMLHYHAWYKKNVTSSLILIVQLCFFLFLFFIVKSNYLFHPTQLQKDFFLNRMMPVLVVIIVGLITLFVLMPFLASKTKIIEQEEPYDKDRYQFVAVRYQKKSGAIEPDDINNFGIHIVANKSADEPIDGESAALEKGTSELNISTSVPVSTEGNNLFTEEPKTDGERITATAEKESVHFIRIRDQRFSRLDLEAADSMFFCAKVYLISMLPGLFSFGILFACDSISEDSISNCPIIARITFYIRCLTLGISSAFFNPIAFVTYSSDFTSAMTQKFSRRSRAKQNQVGRFE